MTTTPLPIVGRRLGGYEVLYALKTGGMGEVVLARKVGAGGFEKLVAIKTVRTEYRQRDEVRRMFFDEARLVARLQHPAIAQVLDFGDDGGELYLVMEYVQGVRFGWLRDHRPPPAIAARAVAEALRGLHAAHELTDLAGNPLEVVHRDITPENLMLSFDGQVKVLDFGIALARGRQAPVTEFGTIKGKPPYLSPEQVKCEPLDRRTDIFSAAIVLYELLTGEPLFVADSVYAVARMIEHRDVPPPSAIAGPLPDGLDEAVLQGLAKRREERFQTAEAFARALDAVADRAGGESLVEYSRRELAAERERHRAWLRGVLAAVDSGLAEAARRGRASGVMTVPGEGAAGGSGAAAGRAGVAAAGGGAAAARAGGPDAPGTSQRGGADAGPSTGSLRLAGSARSARRFVALAAGFAVVAAGLALVATRGAPPSAGAVDAADAGVAVAARPAIVDAGAPATRADARPVDAAPPDAAAPHRPPRRTGRRPPRRPPPPARADAAPPPPEPARGPPGFLTVAAEPFADVRVDGEPVGPTPILRRRLPPGRHEVVLVSPDTGAVRLRRVVHVVSGREVRIVAK